MRIAAFLVVVVVVAAHLLRLASRHRVEDMDENERYENFASIALVRAVAAVSVFTLATRTIYHSGNIAPLRHCNDVNVWESAHNSAAYDLK